MAFKHQPTSLSEYRARKSNDASDWSPRDVLEDCLKGIDSGDIRPESLIIVFRQSSDDDDDDEMLHTFYAMSAKCTHVCLGMMHTAMALIIRTMGVICVGMTGIIAEGLVEIGVIENAVLLLGGVT